MVIIKKNYYLYIENIKNINLDKLITNKKINIILRNTQNDKLTEIIKFRLKCKNKNIKFFIANSAKIAKACDADGLYISAYNKKKYYTNVPKIGSAHNFKEIREKKFQGCQVIIFSRLFKTQYLYKKGYLGVLKFNLLTKILDKKIIPLGGINNQNLLKLNLINCDGFALLSSVKKKPAITSRLF
jgi:thiamine-phosphate pyrophosphorylase